MGHNIANKTTISRQVDDVFFLSWPCKARTVKNAWKDNQPGPVEPIDNLNFFREKQGVSNREIGGKLPLCLLGPQDQLGR
jgi:hypothetical protein